MHPWRKQKVRVFRTALSLTFRPGGSAGNLLGVVFNYGLLLVGVLAFLLDDERRLVAILRLVPLLLLVMLSVNVFRAIRLFNHQHWISRAVHFFQFLATEYCEPGWENRAMGLSPLGITVHEDPTRCQEQFAVEIGRRFGGHYRTAVLDVFPHGLGGTDIQIEKRLFWELRKVLVPIENDLREKIDQ